MKKLMIILVLLLSTIAYMGCEDKTDLKLNGMVTDILDKSPITDAKVRLEEMEWWSAKLLKEVTTNSQGRYELTYTVQGHCPESSLNITITANGYKSISCNILTPCDNSATNVKCTERIQIFNFELEKE